MDANERECRNQDTTVTPLGEIPAHREFSMPLPRAADLLRDPIPLPVGGWVEFASIASISGGPDADFALVQPSSLPS